MGIRSKEIIPSLTFLRNKMKRQRLSGAQQRKAKKERERMLQSMSMRKYITNQLPSSKEHHEEEEVITTESHLTEQREHFQPARASASVTGEGPRGQQPVCQPAGTSKVALEERREQEPSGIQDPASSDGKQEPEHKSMQYSEYTTGDELIEASPSSGTEVEGTVQHCEDSQDSRFAGIAGDGAASALHCCCFSGPGRMIQ